MIVIKESQPVIRLAFGVMCASKLCFFSETRGRLIHGYTGTVLLCMSLCIAC